MFKIVITAAAAVGVWAGAAWAQPSVTDTYQWFDLDTVTNTQGFSTNGTMANQLVKFNLGPNGTVSFNSSNKELTLGGRMTKAACAARNTPNDDWGDCSWQGLDINIGQMKVNGNHASGKYTIHVEGYIPQGTTVPGDSWMAIYQSSDNDKVWDELVYENVKNPTDRFELKWESFPMRGTELADLVSKNYVWRIQTRNGSGMSFVITKFIIKVDPAPEDEFVEWPPPAWQNVESMRVKFKDAFKIGNIMTPGSKMTQLNDSYGSAEFFIKHYNAVTLENDMKPDKTMPEKNQLGNLTDADAVVTWAKSHDIDVVGHTLVWHSQSPDWLNKNADGSPLTRDEAKANMKLFIDKVVGHYKTLGGVKSWDVVNEAFMNVGECLGTNNKETDPVDPDKHWSVALRSSPCHRQILADAGDLLNVNEHTNNNLSPWYDAYANANLQEGESGADYIYDAFVFTRLADPDAVLYYNDYNEEFPLKREAIALMVEELNKKWKTDERNTEKESGRLLIEGIGMQSHYYGGPKETYPTETYDHSKIEPTIVRFAKTGARISITELDIPMGGWDHKYKRAQLLPEEEELQAQRYAELMRTYLKYRKYIDRVTFWGMADKVSWRKSGMPLLFDNSLYPKAAYTAIMAINIESIEAFDIDGVPGKDDDDDGEYDSIKNRKQSLGVKPLMALRGRMLSVAGTNDDKVRVRVINMKGKTVAKHNVKGSANLSLRKLPAGVYMVEAVRAKDKVKNSMRVTLK